MSWFRTRCISDCADIKTGGCPGALNIREADFARATPEPQARKWTRSRLFRCNDLIDEASFPQSGDDVRSAHLEIIAHYHIIGLSGRLAPLGNLGSEIDLLDDAQSSLLDRCTHSLGRGKPA